MPVGGLRSTGRPALITVANGTPVELRIATSHSVTVRVTDRGGLDLRQRLVHYDDECERSAGGDQRHGDHQRDTTQTFTTANFGFSDVDAGDSFQCGCGSDTLPTANADLSGTWR